MAACSSVCGGSDELPPDLQEHAQSWDLAFKGGGEHDFVVGLVAARRGADIHLIDRFKEHASFQETLTAMRRTIKRYPSAGRILVEDKANGSAIIDTLKHEIGGIIAVTPEGGKYARASACEPKVEAGNVYLPTRWRRTGVRSRSGPGSTTSSSRWPCSRSGSTTMTWMPFRSC